MFARLLGWRAGQAREAVCAFTTATLAARTPLRGLRRGDSGVASWGILWPQSRHRFRVRKPRKSAKDSKVTELVPDIKHVKVISIDPGITTGIATGIIRAEEPMEVGSLQRQMEVWELYDWLDSQCPDIILYERFEFRRGTTRTPDAVELFSVQLIGTIRLWWFKRDMYLKSSGLPEMKMYPRMPGQDWQYYTNQKLRADGIYKPSKGDHRNDAARHLLGWFTFGAGYRFNTHGYRPA
jgi:hypothetical protein